MFKLTEAPQRRLWKGCGYLSILGTGGEVPWLLPTPNTTVAYMVNASAEKMYIKLSITLSPLGAV